MFLAGSQDLYAQKNKTKAKKPPKSYRKQMKHSAKSGQNADDLIKKQMESQFTFKSPLQIETNLVEDIKLSSESSRTTKEAENFLIELEAVMTKYKVVSTTASFDVFKMRREVADKIEGRS